MRVFVAGAAGAIGRQLVPMLIGAGHEVTGTTRSAERAASLRSQGAFAVVLDVMDADALKVAVVDARPHVVVHQLTDLAAGFGAEQLRANARLRRVGTRNLMDATLAAGAARMVAQSGAWLYAPGPEPHGEGDPLIDPTTVPDHPVLPGIIELERIVTSTPGVDGLVLRYGFLFGPGRREPTRVMARRSMSWRRRMPPRELSTADCPGSTTSLTTVDRSTTPAHGRSWAGGPAGGREDDLVHFGNAIPSRRVVPLDRQGTLCASVGPGAEPEPQEGPHARPSPRDRGNACPAVQRPHRWYHSCQVRSPDHSRHVAPTDRASGPVGAALQHSSSGATAVSRSRCRPRNCVPDTPTRCGSS